MNDPVTTVEAIDSDLAMDYLTNNRSNRKVSMHTVAKYAEDMKNGAWQLNGEGIVFNESGKLVDGQHRLLAIIKSGVTVRMTVTRGVSDSVSIFDLGRGRSQVDSLVIEGMDKNIANATNAAIARLHYYIVQNKTTISNYELRAFIRKHDSALRQLATIRKKGHAGGITLKNAAIMLPMMRALEAGESYAKILDFAEVLNTGFYQTQEQTSAVVLRNDLMLKKLESGGGAQHRKRVSLCVENAIYDFCRGKARKKSYANCTTPIYSNVNESGPTGSGNSHGDQ